MEDYGLQVFAHGLVLHGMGRSSQFDPDAAEEQVGRRGQIAGHSRSSQRRLEFVAANLAGEFRSLLTLTYHAEIEAWEDDEARNARIAGRSKRDLNRFLSALRPELGDYLWVQEFQRRGVVHYHVLCVGEVGDERASVAWCRATDALSDADAVRYAAKVEPIAEERRARGYVGRYVGKARQKVLPPGVERAGRWWGRSRGLALVPVDEVVSRERETGFRRSAGIRIVRGVRRYLSKAFGFKFRGGAVVDWGGTLAGKVRHLVRRLRAFYGSPRSVGASITAAGKRTLGRGGVE